MRHFGMLMQAKTVEAKRFIDTGDGWKLKPMSDEQRKILEDWYHNRRLG